MGELYDLYDGYLWRSERETQDQLGHTFMLMKTSAMSDSKELTFEKLLGRPTYPFLRSLQKEPTVIVTPDPMDKLKATLGEGTPAPVESGKLKQDLKDLKAEFKDIFKKGGKK